MNVSMDPDQLASHKGLPAPGWLRPHGNPIELFIAQWAIYNSAKLCLGGAFPCVDFITMGDVLFEWDTSMCRFHVCYHGGCTV